MEKGVFIKRHFICLVLFVMGLLPSFGYNIDGIDYSFGGDTAKVTGANSDIVNVVIPATVVYNEKEYTVTTIYDGAFSSNTKIKSVTLANTVKYIGKNAFNGCSKLTKVSADGITIIGDRAFYSCRALSTFNFENVRRIGNYAFQYNNFTSISFGSEIWIIGEYAFHDCKSLKKVTSEEGQPKLSIGLGAFGNCTALEEIDLGNLNSLSGNAPFQNCTELRVITLGAEGMGGNSIGGDAFYGCEKIDTIYCHMKGFDTRALKVTPKYFYFSDPQFKLSATNGSSTSRVTNANVIFRATLKEDIQPFCIKYAIREFLSDGITAYSYDSLDPTTGQMKLNKISMVISQGTGFLLCGKKGDIVMAQIFDLDNPHGNNNEDNPIDGFVGTLQDTNVPEVNGSFTNYMFKDGQFVKVDAAGETCPANTAYLHIKDAGSILGCTIGENSFAGFSGNNEVDYTIIPKEPILYTGDKLLLTTNLEGSTWTSSNEDVATVDGSGLVTGVTPGAVKILAQGSDGAPIEYDITVKEKHVFGDVNNDGKVNTFDITAIRNYVLYGNVNGKQ